MVRTKSRQLWIVSLITQAPGDEPEPGPNDKRARVLANLLAQAYGAEADASGGAVQVRMPILEADPVHEAAEAAYQAQMLVLDALRQLELDGWEIGPGEAVAVPEILGVQEVTNAIGVTRQRLHELRRSGRFPEPIAELAAGPIWLRTDVNTFVAGWRRTTGRPSLGCDGDLVKHFDGSRSCTVCTVARRDPDTAAHSRSHACFGCPVCSTGNIA